MAIRERIRNLLRSDESSTQGIRETYDGIRNIHYDRDSRKLDVHYASGSKMATLPNIFQVSMNIPHFQEPDVLKVDEEITNVAMTDITFKKPYPSGMWSKTDNEFKIHPE